jgi:hypothetical protein
MGFGMRTSWTGSTRIAGTNPWWSAPMALTPFATFSTPCGLSPPRFANNFLASTWFLLLVAESSSRAAYSNEEHAAGRFGTWSQSTQVFVRLPLSSGLNCFVVSVAHLDSVRLTICWHYGAASTALMREKQKLFSYARS